MVAYNVFTQHANALAERSHLYAHMFCDDIGPAGQAIGYNRFYIPKCIRHLTAVISDNQRELNSVADIFNFDQAKLFTHYQPVDLWPIRRRPIRDHLDVLWAGRWTAKTPRRFRGNRSTLSGSADHVSCLWAGRHGAQAGRATGGPQHPLPRAI